MIAVLATLTKPPPIQAYAWMNRALLALINNATLPDREHDPPGTSDQRTTPRRSLRARNRCSERQGRGQPHCHTPPRCGTAPPSLAPGAATPSLASGAAAGVAPSTPAAAGASSSRASDSTTPAAGSPPSHLIPNPRILVSFAYLPATNSSQSQFNDGESAGAYDRQATSNLVFFLRNAVRAKGLRSGVDLKAAGGALELVIHWIRTDDIAEVQPPAAAADSFSELLALLNEPLPETSKLGGGNSSQKRPQIPPPLPPPANLLASFRVHPQARSHE